MSVPNRKYVSEFAVSLFSARWLVVTPSQLSSGLEMDAPASELSRHCHLYLICRRPAVAFDAVGFSYDGAVVRGHLVYRVAGVQTRVPFELPFQLADDAVRVELAPYPHREFNAVASTGEKVRYVPAMALTFGAITRERILSELEVLYVGQAYGDGNRTALDRLRSHSTLQKILADMQYSLPDDELLLLTFEYAPYRLITSIDGITRAASGGEQDSKRFISIVDNPLSKHQQICLAEAGLIRYFQPKYNDIYKESFPASDQKILSACYDLDFSALITEIDTEDLGLLLYSPRVRPAWHHIAKFDLVDSSVRRSFFTLVDRSGKVAEQPNVIAPSR